jgi:tetratricopeptide (TPR) repeat protein
MKKTMYDLAFAVAAAFLAASMFSGVSLAQGTTNAGAVSNSMTTMDGRQAEQSMKEQYLRQGLGDPKEEAAYQAFHKAGEDTGDKKIHLGLTFLAKYPTDRYTEAVYEELSQAYYNRKDLPSFYMYSEKGLSLFPDDVHLLALSGWVIPRAYDAHESDADKKLERAEAYEKHALDLIDKMQKPDGLTANQFAEFRTGELAVVHSGLGLVYFRREQYDTSEKELEIATKNEPTPDPTDLYVLGADLANLSRYQEAADAFNRCAQIAGSVQDNCKKYAADATQRASESK